MINLKAQVFDIIELQSIELLRIEKEKKLSQQLLESLENKKNGLVRQLEILKLTKEITCELTESQNSQDTMT